MRRGKLLLQMVAPVLRRQEQPAVHTAEVAVDALLLRDPADHLDGGGMALRRQPGAGLPDLLLQEAVAVVDGVGEMGRGPAGLPAADGSLVHHQDLPSLAGQQTGRGHPGDARADDHHVGRRIAVDQGIGREGQGRRHVQVGLVGRLPRVGQRRVRLRKGRRVHPERFRHATATHRQASCTVCTVGIGLPATARSSGRCGRPASGVGGKGPGRRVHGAVIEVPRAGC